MKYNESTLRPDDERIRLAREWVEACPGAKELFDLWTTIPQVREVYFPAPNLINMFFPQRQMALNVVVMSLLACLLDLLSIHYPDQSYGLAILRTLLLPQWYQKLNTHLHGSHSESILVAMKLYTAMSNFGGGRERKVIMEVFAWDNKVAKLLNMRRRGRRGTEVKDTLSRPGECRFSRFALTISHHHIDIRALYVLFILSFVDITTPTSLKTAFLEQRRGSLAAIFKGLSEDSYSVVRLVLEKLWGGLWSDPKLKKTHKINLFNETVLSHVRKILAFP